MYHKNTDKREQRRFHHKIKQEKSAAWSALEQKIEWLPVDISIALSFDQIMDGSSVLCLRSLPGSHLSLSRAQKSLNAIIITTATVAHLLSRFGRSE